jgi:hypothetical protein
MRRAGFVSPACFAYIHPRRNQAFTISHSFNDRASKKPIRQRPIKDQGVSSLPAAPTMDAPAMFTRNHVPENIAGE